MVEVANILKLINPGLEMKTSFLYMISDYINNNEFLDHRQYFKDDFIFENYINYLEERKNLPISSKDPVQQYEWWLVDDEDNIVGTSRLRSVLETEVEINEEGNIGYDIAPSYRKKGYGQLILRLTLENAKNFGFEKIFITCSENNLASKKIIEKNAGVFHSKFYSKEDQENLLRYWIHII